FGDQLTPEKKRREIGLLTSKTVTNDRENAGNEALAALYRSGNYDPNATSAEAVRAGITAANTAGFKQFHDVNTYGAGSTEGTNATMGVPGASYGNTVQGKNAEPANERTIQGMQEGTKLRIEGQKPQTVLQPDDNGNLV